MLPRSMAVLFGIVLSVAALPLAAPPARAADVNVTLIAFNLAWHVGSESSIATTITVNVNDTLRLRIENHDTLDHTFTAPQFTVDIPLPPNAVAFWNHTVVASEIASWQFYCAIPGHAPGTYPNRTGMIGVLAFVTPPPPSPPAGISTLVIAGVVLLIVVAIAAVALLMRRRKPAPPTPPTP